MIFKSTYREAWESGYRNLVKATPYSVDYALLDTTSIEPLIRRIRTSMEGAGMNVESSKGECNLGQHEINFRYGPALSACDDHSIYKFGAKEIAAQEGYAITFMAKFDQREGSSCHVHISLVGADGSNVFASNKPLFEHFLAGQLACLRELTLLFAPQINSYKRYVPGMFAPTAVAWGHDNRTCAMRVIGHGAGLHIENRLPGADVNPYLAVAAMIAAGLHGVDSKLVLEPATKAAPTKALTSACRTRCARRETCSRRASLRAPRLATRSSTITCTARTSSWPRSSRRSPIGSGSEVSSGCEGSGRSVRRGRRQDVQHRAHLRADLGGREGGSAPGGVPRGRDAHLWRSDRRPGAGGRTAGWKVRRQSHAADGPSGGDCRGRDVRGDPRRPSDLQHRGRGRSPRRPRRAPSQAVPVRRLQREGIRPDGRGRGGDASRRDRRLYDRGRHLLRATLPSVHPERRRSRSRAARAARGVGRGAAEGGALGDHGPLARDREHDVRGRRGHVGGGLLRAEHGGRSARRDPERAGRS